MITTRDQIIQLIRETQQAGGRVGFTSGVFDIVHASHVDLLARAAALCDLLIVGVNSDASVRRNKGPGRPIVPEDQRLAVIAALRAVGAAFLFDEPNNHDNIYLLRPDLYIKGGQYSTTPMTSAPLVEAYGGKAIVIPTLPSPTSTEIIARIKAQP